MLESLTECQFWAGISVLINNFHAVNKKLAGCVLNEVWEVTRGIECLRSPQKLHHRLTAKDLAASGAECASCDQSEMLAILGAHAKSLARCQGFVINFTFLTKKLNRNIEAVGIVDLSKTAYSLKTIGMSDDDFCVKLQSNVITVDTLTQVLPVDSTTHWMNNVLKPKLNKWCRNVRVDSMASQERRSLRLVDNEYYNDIYKKLKKKYANELLKYWMDVQESTDPLKFIYEDLAIAAYLLSLWRKAFDGSTAPTAFADLGCGNGLLVYILNKEGFKGYGYDIRARKLWSLYDGMESLLMERAIEPSNFNLPADVDWLIGNHSDELSPWIPVLSATSRYDMKYFLLPCCAFEFSGSKFQRRNSNTSTYADFMQYAAAISEKCGFKTLRDRLKIPSTKRLALIAVERVFGQAENAQKMLEIQNFVKEEKDRHPNSTQEDIKLREKHEVVRNCTQVDKTLLEYLVKKIFMMLLEHFPDPLTSDATQAGWNAGGRLKMGQIAQLLSKDDLKHIKSESGGLQTLLRNNHAVFALREHGYVEIRKPTVPEVQPQTLKKRLCFFKVNHPNGCPLTDAECTFLH